MAWTAPRTWASGEIPTAAQLNTDLRDNLNELSRHAHGGGSGSGTAALGNLVSMTFIDAAAPAAPGGTLTRLYSSSTALFWRNAGGIYSASTAGHEHSIATGTIILGGNTATAATAVVDVVNSYTAIASGGVTTLLTQTATWGGTGSRAIIVSAYAAIHLNGGGGSDGIAFAVSRDGTGVVSTSSAISLSGTQLVSYEVTGIETNRPAGSCTYSFVVSLATATNGGGTVYGRGLFLTEVKQQ